jgi:hypothetical protein
MNHEHETNPLASTYYGDMLSVKLSALAQFQQSQSDESHEIDRYTLVGFFFEIRKIAEEAINDLMEDEE